VELAVAYRFPSTAPATAAQVRSSHFYSAGPARQTWRGRERGWGDGVMMEALTCGGGTQHGFGQEQESKVAATTAHGAGDPASARCTQRNRGPGACTR